MAQKGINNRYELLLIGGSAGSLEVLLQLLPALRGDLPLAVVIVLHRKPVESVLTELLANRTTWPVKEAEEKESVLPQHIYIAPPDYHLLIERDRTFSLDVSEKLHYSRPAIDATFETAADAYGAATAALLLSGANADGVQGLQDVRAAGGLTIVQDPAEATVSYMPQQAIGQVPVDYVADTAGIADIINRLNI